MAHWQLCTKASSGHTNDAIITDITDFQQNLLWLLHLVASPQPTEVGAPPKNY